MQRGTEEVDTIDKANEQQRKVQHHAHMPEPMFEDVLADVHRNSPLSVSGISPMQLVFGRNPARIMICWLPLTGRCEPPVSASLSGDLPDHFWWQATTGVTCGGLALRTALGVRASRLRGQPHHVPRPGLRLASGTLSQPIMAEYDARTDEALARLVSPPPPSPAPGERSAAPGGTAR